VNHLFIKILAIFILSFMTLETVTAAVVIATYISLELIVISISKFRKIFYTRRLIDSGTFYKASV